MKPCDADREVTVSRDVAAPRAVVWAAWTEPAHALRWYGPHGFTTPVCEMDVRGGGAFRLCMRSSRGIDCWEVGIFEEVAAPRRIVSVYTATVGDEAGVDLHSEVAFEEIPGGTRVIVRQTFVEATFTAGAREGTEEALERLSNYIQTMAISQQGAQQ